MRARSQSGFDIAKAAVLAICLALPSVAWASSGDAERAEKVFLEGKAHLAQRDYAGACLLFAESYRLEVATGTLLALAICHERTGKLASAYREYSGVLARSKQEPREDRERAARERATALATQISTLTLSNTQTGQAAGLEVRLDGTAVAAAQFGKPIPIDGGEHVIEAWAPGRKTWRSTVKLAASRDACSVIIPALEADKPKAKPAVQRSAPRAQETRAPQPDAGPKGTSTSTTTVQWLGIAAISVGVAGLGAGGFFTLRALSKNQASNDGCSSDLCDAEARRDRLDARRAGDIATVAFAAGGALAATGFVLMIVGGPSESDDAHGAVTAAPWVAPRAAGATVRGTF